MSNIITSCGTNAVASGLPQPSQMIFDGTNYWIFYGHSTQSGKLCYRTATNLASWGTESTATAANFPVDARLSMVLFSGSTVLVFWYDSSNPYVWYQRGVISGTSITWAGAVLVVIPPTVTTYALAGVLNASSVPELFIADNNGEYQSHYKATNAIGPTFADTTTSWTQTGPQTNHGAPSTAAMFPLASLGVLTILDQNAAGTNYLESAIYSGSAWGGWTTIWSGTAASLSLWAAVQVTALGNPYVLGVSAASTLSFKQWSGSVWTSLTAPTWPTNGLGTTSSVSLTTDGTNVYAQVIDGSGYIQINEYSVSGATWGGWTELAGDIADTSRTYIQTGPYISAPLSIYTHTNGSNYEIWAATPGGSFTASPAAIPARHSGSITLTLTGTGTSWTSGSTVTVQNSVTGTTIVTEGTWTQSSGTAATLTVTTGAGTGTFTVTVNGLVSSSLTVNAASFTISPTTNSTTQTTTITATGTNTLWSSESASTLFSVSGGTGASISGTPSVTSNTAATFSLVDGSAAGTLTITDAPTTDTATFSVTPMPTTATLSAPGSLSGNVGAASGNFTITLDHPAPIGGIVCTITDSVSNSEIS